jgi:hypothetical protein
VETVKVSVKGAGSLEVEGAVGKDILEGLKAMLRAIPNVVVREIKRGPKKKETPE